MAPQRVIRKTRLPTHVYLVIFTSFLWKDVWLYELNNRSKNLEKRQIIKSTDTASDRKFPITKALFSLLGSW